jgi:hypothetical protein
LSQTQAEVQEDKAEAQAYLKETGRGGGFGMTLGEALKKARKTGE